MLLALNAGWGTLIDMFVTGATPPGAPYTVALMPPGVPVGFSAAAACAAACACLRATRGSTNVPDGMPGRELPPPDGMRALMLVSPMADQPRSIAPFLNIPKPFIASPYAATGAGRFFPTTLTSTTARMSPPAAMAATVAGEIPPTPVGVAGRCPNTAVVVFATEPKMLEMVFSTPPPPLAPALPPPAEPLAPGVYDDPVTLPVFKSGFEPKSSPSEGTELPAPGSAAPLAYDEVNVSPLDEPPEPDASNEGGA